MKRIKFIGIFIISIFLLCFQKVNALETITEKNSSLYRHALIDLPFTEKSYNQFKNFFNNYIEQNLDSNNLYFVFYADTLEQLRLTTVPFDFNLSNIFKVNNASFSTGSINLNQTHSFKFEFLNDNNDISITYSGISNPNTSHTIDLDFFTTYPLIWSNKNLKYNGDELENFYSYRFTNIDDRLKTFYNFEKLSPELPIYTYCNLLFGDYEEEKPKEKVFYQIEYYFDDILDVEKTEYHTGFIDSTIRNFSDFSSDLYKLYTENQNYELILTSDISTNVLKIYYRSPLYGTEKTPIDTSTSKIYLFFQFSDIKSMFPNIQFANFTQFQQLIIVVLFNILYCLFLFFCSFVLLKAVFKCWSWITMWF